MITFFERMSDLLSANTPFVSVTVVDAIGSIPNEVGGKMLVTRDGLFFGTVGGGKVENRAIQEAMSLLGGGEPSGRSDATTRFVNWVLDRDIGMTCGGSVKLYFEAFNVRNWNITIFGAGHVSNALARILINLDCRVTCIDPRPEWLDKLPDAPALRRVAADDMPGCVARLPCDSYVVLITMGHGTDKPILLEILKNWQARSFPYVGVIGSKAKAARLRADIKEAGLPQEAASLYYCPVGLPIGGNHPQEIAISIAAQLLKVRDEIRSKKGAQEKVLNERE